MDPKLEELQQVTRRSFLKSTSHFCLGAIALASLAEQEAQATGRAAVNPLAARPPHFPSKVKRVIYLHMSGGPPHLDLFDYKPELVKWDSKPCPDEFLKRSEEHTSELQSL